MYFFVHQCYLPLAFLSCHTGTNGSLLPLSWEVSRIISVTDGQLVYLDRALQRAVFCDGVASPWLRKWVSDLYWINPSETKSG